MDCYWIALGMPWSMEKDGVVWGCLRERFLGRCSSDEGMRCKLKGKGILKSAYDGYV